jgi:hypothetical protein
MVMVMLVEMELVSVEMLMLVEMKVLGVLGVLEVLVLAVLALAKEMLPVERLRTKVGLVARVGVGLGARQYQREA